MFTQYDFAYKNQLLNKIPSFDWSLVYWHFLRSWNSLVQNRSNKTQYLRLLHGESWLHSSGAGFLSCQSQSFLRDGSVVSNARPVNFAGWSGFPFFLRAAPWGHACQSLQRDPKSSSLTLWQTMMLRLRWCRCCSQKQRRWTHPCREEGFGKCHSLRRSLPSMHSMKWHHTWWEKDFEKGFESPCSYLVHAESIIRLNFKTRNRAVAVEKFTICPACSLLFHFVRC